MTDDAVYQGHNRFLQWWPGVMIALGVVVMVSDSGHALQWAALFASIAYAHARWLPYAFTIGQDGVTLVFPFGRRRFLPRELLKVRVEMVGAVAIVAPRRRFGYLLLERMGYLPGHEEEMRSILGRLGYVTV